MTTSDAGFVVDASVVLKWYLRDEEHAGQADLLQRAFETGRLDLTSPNYVRYEVAIGLEIAHRQGRLAAELLHDCLANFLALPVYQERDADQLLHDAMRLSAQYEVSPYDALYLGLAEQSGYPLVTADARLYRRVRSRVPYVRWIGDVKLS